MGLIKHEQWSNSAVVAMKDPSIEVALAVSKPIAPIQFYCSNQSELNLNYTTMTSQQPRMLLHINEIYETHKHISHISNSKQKFSSFLAHKRSDLLAERLLNLDTKLKC